MIPAARGPIVATFACFLALFAAHDASAHDVPADVTVVAFVKPDGHRLTLIVRLPMTALSPSSVLFGGVVIPSGPAAAGEPEAIERPLRDAARIVASLLPLYEGDRSLSLEAIRAVRWSSPDDRSFASYDRAVAHLAAAAVPGQGLEAGEGFFDASLEYRIDSDRADFSLEPRVTALAERPVVAVRFMPAGSHVVRAYEVTADAGRFRLDPHWYHAAFGFVAAGVVHILGGADHLLFLICLVIPSRRWQSLIPVVTAFTAAHSITLIASAYQLAPGGAWFGPLIETAIAGSIVYMAVENVFVASPRRRWISTFLFGLAHGFGFSFGLRDSLQFAGSHLLTSLFSFNAGVEIGQVAVLLVTAPVLSLLFRQVVPERRAAIVLSVIVAHVGWHWFLERGSAWLRLAAPPPAVDAVCSWLVAVLVGASLVRVLVPRFLAPADAARHASLGG